jgi:hypothetical protein
VIWSGRSGLPKVVFGKVGKVMMAVGMVADCACTFADRPINSAIAAVTACFREILIYLDYLGSPNGETAFTEYSKLPVMEKKRAELANTQ